MPVQLHAQARIMHQLAVVTSLVQFFRSLGGIIALTLMSSVVNNKVSQAFPSTSGKTSLYASLPDIQSLPPLLREQVQDVFSEGIRWAYIALLPFVCTAAISSFFLWDVKVERSSKEAAGREEKQDVELGQIRKDEAPVGDADEALLSGCRRRIICLD
jgi:hypothetical protein